MKGGMRNACRLFYCSAITYNSHPRLSTTASLSKLKSNGVRVVKYQNQITALQAALSVSSGADCYEDDIWFLLPANNSWDGISVCLNSGRAIIGQAEPPDLLCSLDALCDHL